MDSFLKYELGDRALFKSILDLCGITDLHPSTEKYDSVDYYYSSPHKAGVAGVEIKKRDIKYLTYDTLLMEVSKFKAIAARIKSKELDRAYYVNFIGDNVAYIFNLRDIARAGREKRLLITTLYANVTTAVDKGKMDKRVLLIPKSIGIKLEKIENKWIKTN